jgi:hypothetical protein
VTPRDVAAYTRHGRPLKSAQAHYGVGRRPGRAGARLVEETTRAQGIPVKISNPATIEFVAAILREGRRKLVQDQA